MQVVQKSQKAMMRYKFSFDTIKKICQNQLKYQRRSLWTKIV